MNSDIDTSTLEQFATENDLSTDGLSLDRAESLTMKLRKSKHLKNRGVDDRAVAVEEEVLDALEAAGTPDTPDDGPSMGGSTAREIQLPDGLSADDAAALIDAAASVDDPKIVSADALEGAKEAFADVLAQQSPLSAESLAGQSLDALAAPFREVGSGMPDATADTMTQTPETQSGGVGDAAGDGTSDFDPDVLSLSDREELRRLKRKATSFRARGVDKRADTLEAEMADIADVDDAGKIEWEQL
jgi:hypothetical protein